MSRSAASAGRQHRSLIHASLLASGGLLLLLAVQALLPSRRPSVLAPRGSDGEQLAKAGSETQAAPAAAGYSSAPAAAAAAALRAAGAVAVQHSRQHTILIQAAEVFQTFVSQHEQKLEAVWRRRLEGTAERGIVVAAGMPRTLANAFVSLHVLRHTLRCRLPVTIMYWGSAAEDVPTQETIRFMQAHVPDVQFVDASALPWPAWHERLSRTAGWQNASTVVQELGWKAKVFAMYAAPYKHVMYLDSDATPALDPAPLFDHPLYQATGSMFWQELWCGNPPLFDWLGMPPMRPGDRQTESGIVLLDRQRHWPALEWALWFNLNDRFTYKLAYGDKDTFRAAFYLAGRLIDFSQLDLPHALMLEARQGGFYNRGYLQPHPNGTSMFIHRVGLNKFDPGQDDLKPLTHATVPSCLFYREKGWHPAPGERPEKGLYNDTHFQSRVFTEGEPDLCPFSMHTLYDAAVRCGGYDFRTANGSEPLPVFEISQEGHVGRALSDAAAAFRLLRAEMRQRGPTSLLFRPSAGEGSSGCSSEARRNRGWRCSARD